MSENEQQLNASERGAAEDKAAQPAEKPPHGGHEVPLFLRGISDGSKGNAQDEKDSVGE